MKKLFNFRSSNSGTGTNQVSRTSTAKQVYWEKPSDDQGKSRSKMENTEKHDDTSAPSFRSGRLSSSVISGGEFGPASNLFDQNGPSCSTNYDAKKQMKCNTAWLCTLTRERRHPSKFSEPTAVEVSWRQEKPSGSFSWELFDSSDCSSYCSSDHYIDGEQQQGKEKDMCPVRKCSETGINPQRHPPVVQHANSGSPTNHMRHNRRLNLLEKLIRPNFILPQMIGEITGLLILLHRSLTSKAGTYFPREILIDFHKRIILAMQKIPCLLST